MAEGSLEIIEKSRTQSPFDSFVPLLGTGQYRCFGFLTPIGWKLVSIVYVNENATSNSLALLELNLRTFLSTLHQAVVDCKCNPLFGLSFDDLALSPSEPFSPFESSIAISRVVATFAPLDFTERLKS